MVMFGRKDLEINTISKSRNKKMKHWRVRKKQTIDFIKSLNIKFPERFLDIGDKNEMGKAIGKEFNSKVYFTHYDLDGRWWFPFSEDTIYSYKIVTCLDVLEHLLNPLLFLERLRLFVDDTSNIAVTYPHSNSEYWGKQHWHEFYENEFLYLLKRANYKPIIKQIKEIDYYDIKKERYFWLIRRL